MHFARDSNDRSHTTVLVSHSSPILSEIGYDPCFPQVTPISPAMPTNGSQIFRSTSPLGTRKTWIRADQ